MLLLMKLVMLESNEISDVRKSSQQTITEKISNFNPIESDTKYFYR